MELARYKACICEGSAERAIMDNILLDDTCGGGVFLAGTKREQRGDIE